MSLGGSGFSSHLPPSRRARVLGQNRVNERARCDSLRLPRRHDVCGWEGLAEVWQDDYTHQFFCENCDRWIVTWDYEDELRDGGDGIAPHTDDDGLWPPQSLEDRESA